MTPTERLTNRLERMRTAELRSAAYWRGEHARLKNIELERKPGRTSGETGDSLRRNIERVESKAAAHEATARDLLEELEVIAMTHAG